MCPNPTDLLYPYTWLLSFGLSSQALSDTHSVSGLARWRFILSIAPLSLCTICFFSPRKFWIFVSLLAFLPKSPPHCRCIYPIHWLPFWLSIASRLHMRGFELIILFLSLGSGRTSMAGLKRCDVGRILHGFFSCRVRGMAEEQISRITNVY
jgi:hypothetical protein